MCLGALFAEMPNSTDHSSTSIHFSCQIWFPSMDLVGLCCSKRPTWSKITFWSHAGSSHILFTFAGCSHAKCFDSGNMAYAFGLSPPMAAVLGKVSWKQKRLQYFHNVQVYVSIYIHIGSYRHVITTASLNMRYDQNTTNICTRILHDCCWAKRTKRGWNVLEGSWNAVKRQGLSL